jgi:hypothetical protein
MVGVRVLSWEHEPTVYELRGGRAILVAGRDLGPVEVGPGDATAVGLEQRAYGPEDGKRFLRALLITFRGTRMWSERV